jgi:hypothetical protein
MPFPELSSGFKSKESEFLFTSNAGKRESGREKFIPEKRQFKDISRENNSEILVLSGMPINPISMTCF